MRNSKGFTLMEVLTAITIIAIISGPLLYLFVTSTRVGRHSYISDKANAMSVELIEEIKANPGNWTAKGYADAPVIVDGVELHNYSKTIYFDSDWSIVGESTAEFRADISLSESESSLGVSMSFIPELVVADGSNAGKSYRLETVTKDNLPSNINSTITMKRFGSSLSISDSFNILRNTLNGDTVAITIPVADCSGGVIPIVIDVENEPQDYIHFTVDNRTSMEISFYIYGDNERDMDGNYLRRVSAETINGSISTNYMQVSGETLDYDRMEVNVVFSYMDGGRKICDYTTLIYLPA